ncbi:hypothetical protein SAMN03159496_01509 [Rhizobium sp. NFR07]|jgi:hypothetical protein|uniref:hypothetical protein n=1 Tax=Rhizobium sp. NFR07 TaxID=1566262 RepID=UPI0008F14DBA|nr:hypothetical protein [Rhizobium sp. NFR07]SFB04496.1 hypothetical protein SAMN03159496_01509 [Rhizobium sp. NFR07]
MDRKMVEATVKVDGTRIPVGLMNVGQALELPRESGMRFSHPDGMAGETEHLLTRNELASLVEQRAS